MNLEKGEKLAGLSRIAESGEEEGQEEQDSGTEDLE
jgi:hypothetical protein